VVGGCRDPAGLAAVIETVYVVKFCSPVIVWLVPVIPVALPEPHDRS
jgi:hypothetical protein